MKNYCQKALEVLQDSNQTWHAKWIAEQILANSGYSGRQIDMLKNDAAEKAVESLYA